MPDTSWSGLYADTDFPDSRSEFHTLRRKPVFFFLLESQLLFVTEQGEVARSGFLICRAPAWRSRHSVCWGDWLSSIYQWRHWGGCVEWGAHSKSVSVALPTCGFRSLWVRPGRGMSYSVGSGRRRFAIKRDEIRLHLKEGLFFSTFCGKVFPAQRRVERTF